MNAAKPLPLRGMGIVVTRPRHQAEPLCRRIEAQGGEAIRFPTLEILPPRHPDRLQAIIARLDDYDIALFTSPNAVQWSLDTVFSQRDLPHRWQVFAIGKGTARALQQYEISVQFPEQGFNSEALLTMPALQTVKNKRIIIFRGEGGRELLGNTLKERGGKVTYAEMYRRGKPDDTSPVELLQRWQAEGIQAIIVTSDESLRNLFDLVGGFRQQWLCNIPLIVVSHRTRELAQKLGFVQPPLLAREASDEAIVETLLNMAPSQT